VIFLLVVMSGCEVGGMETHARYDSAHVCGFV
jgi:hypothetical protein